MTPKTPLPARLFVLLARSAPVGVIFCRKSSKWVQLIKWNTYTDTFEMGQWFHGRVNVLNSDLSPNGEFLLYLADKYGNWRYNPDVGNVWTAISRPPYFSALALWPSGSGGYFIDDESVHVGSGEQIHPDFPLQRFKLASEFSPYRDLLERKGWLRIQNGVDTGSDNLWMMRLDPPTIWQKETAISKLFAIFRGRKRRHGFIYEYSSFVKEKNLEIKLDQATWADFDQQKRLVLAKAGKLFSAAVIDGELVLTELADFNANQPEAIESPAWAKKW